MDGHEYIALERKRQINVEGYSIKRDVSENPPGTLVEAGMAYIYSYLEHHVDDREFGDLADSWWPWPNSEFAPEKHTPIKRLVIAGALIAAELDRCIAAGEVGDDETLTGSGIQDPTRSGNASGTAN